MTNVKVEKCFQTHTVESNTLVFLNIDYICEFVTRGIFKFFPVVVTNLLRSHYHSYGCDDSCCESCLKSIDNLNGQSCAPFPYVLNFIFFRFII